MAALFLGLGLSVHPTLIFLLPVFVAAYHRSYKYTPAVYFLMGLTISFTCRSARLNIRRSIGEIRPIGGISGGW